MKKKDYEHYKKIIKIYNRSDEFNEFISKINYLQLKKILKKSKKIYNKKNKNVEILKIY